MSLWGCVEVEKSGSSSNGDTVGEGSYFGVTYGGDSMCSISLHDGLFYQLRKYWADNF